MRASMDRIANRPFFSLDMVLLGAGVIVGAWFVSTVLVDALSGLLF